MGKLYGLFLPVFKQGDDLATSIEITSTLPEAFERQADLYADASRVCRQMAGVAREMPELEVDASTHLIRLDGPEERLDELARQGLVMVQDYDGYEDEGCEDFEPEDNPENES